MDPAERVIGAGKLRLLLAALVLRAPEPVTSAQLVAELWGGRPPRSAQGALHVHVARLRVLLDPLVVHTVPGGYRLDVLDTDLSFFRAHVAAAVSADRAGDPVSALAEARNALALGRPGWLPCEGPLLRGAADLVDGSRRRALEIVADSLVTLGRAREALSLMTAAVDTEPLHEPFHLRLMRALRAAKRPGEALMAYREAERLLASELGVEPGPALRRERDHILNP
ncbi:AfsR/SARP family transcriptional regulator [Saccharothrix sp. S26]|uniref:AfsR/SARP family transcriptional regulator n=1 Tax=Saccharothrix sp. S26 TaxID=2907215 RepID=UPI001F389172|nr:AfsR/SARP family transcriptional regulator [Saccharothrix sp. S26]MCE6996339.1 AfsR/SARP family transcriptional regulator [Saccharothrix sp. S26]